jgi:hypothetical protein
MSDHLSVFGNDSFCCSVAAVGYFGRVGRVPAWVLPGLRLSADCGQMGERARRPMTQPRCADRDR